MNCCQSFLRKNSPAIGRSLLVFFYYVVGIAYYQRAEGWDTTDCIYFITGPPSAVQIVTSKIITFNLSLTSLTNSHSYSYPVINIWSSVAENADEQSLSQLSVSLLQLYFFCALCRPLYSMTCA